MMINLRELMIECASCGVMNPINSVRRFGESWVVLAHCPRCEERDEREMDENYADFVQNSQTSLQDFTQNQEPNPESLEFAARSVGRRRRKKETKPRETCRCSRCGALGRRTSPKRGNRCVECEFREFAPSWRYVDGEEASE